MAFSSKRKKPRRPWDRACCFFIYFIAFFSWALQFGNLRVRRRNTDLEKQLEPVSSTSRCGARQHAMTSIPEISAPDRLYCELSFIYLSAPDRAGREKCRPLDHMRQIPFIHKAPFVSHIMVNFYIYSKLFHIFLPCGIYIVLKYCTFAIYASVLFRTPYFKVQRHFEVILSLLTHWQEIQRDIGTKTRYKCIIIRRSQHANFASLRKERVWNAHWLLHATLDRPRVKRDVLFKPFKQLIIFLRRRGKVQLSKI